MPARGYPLRIASSDARRIRIGRSILRGGLPRRANRNQKLRPNGFGLPAAPYSWLPPARRWLKANLAMDGLDGMGRA